jgi:ribosomal-protein-serine acetyltransferase
MDELKLPDLTNVGLAVREGIVLRSFTHDDAIAIFEAVKRNTGHLHFMHWITPDYSVESAREFVGRSVTNAASGESLSLGLFAEGDFIGSVGFVRFDVGNRRTEVGYWVDSAFEGRGIIRDAVSVLIGFAFSELGMNRIEIKCVAENVRSATVARRLGFRQEAHLREYEFRDGKPYDYFTFGLLRSDID